MIADECPACSFPNDYTLASTEYKTHTYSQIMVSSLVTNSNNHDVTNLNNHEDIFNLDGGTTVTTVTDIAHIDTCGVVKSRKETFVKKDSSDCVGENEVLSYLSQGNPECVCDESACSNLLNEWAFDKYWSFDAIDWEGGICQACSPTTYDNWKTSNGMDTPNINVIDITSNSVTLSYTENANNYWEGKMVKEFYLNNEKLDSGTFSDTGSNITINDLTPNIQYNIFVKKVPKTSAITNENEYKKNQIVRDNTKQSSPLTFETISAPTPISPPTTSPPPTPTSPPPPTIDTNGELAISESRAFIRYPNGRVVNNEWIRISKLVGDDWHQADSFQIPNDTTEHTVTFNSNLEKIETKVNRYGIRLQKLKANSTYTVDISDTNASNAYYRVKLSNEPYGYGVIQTLSPVINDTTIDTTSGGLRVHITYTASNWIPDRVRIQRYQNDEWNSTYMEFKEANAPEKGEWKSRTVNGNQVNMKWLNVNSGNPEKIRIKNLENGYYKIELGDADNSYFSKGNGFSFPPVFRIKSGELCLESDQNDGALEHENHLLHVMLIEICINNGNGGERSKMVFTE